LPKTIPERHGDHDDFAYIGCDEGDDVLPVEPPLCLEKIRHDAKAFESVTGGIYKQSRRVDCKAHGISYVATLDSRGKRDVAKLAE